MPPIALIEKSRGLADRIPQSLVALTARLAAATVFWRSGQTKVDGLLARRRSRDCLSPRSNMGLFGSN
jgi:uncharacterized membrane protein YphA (DoxX/SURF4 family)